MDESVNPAPARLDDRCMRGFCLPGLRRVRWSVTRVGTVTPLRVRLLVWMRVALLSLFGLTLLTGSLQAQTLPDPTRPALGTSQPGAAEESPGGPQLQSILISPKRKLAVINGQTLHVGDSFGNAVVVKISAQEVVLKSGGELQVLKLFPGVEKRKSSAGKVASQKVKDR